MMPFREILAAPGGVLLRISQILLLLGQLSFCIYARWQRRKPAVQVLGLLHFLAGFLLLSIFLDLTFDFTWDQEIAFRALKPALVEAAGAAPWPAILLLELASAVILLLCIRSAREYGKSCVLPGAIKETVDLLPVGICFSDPSGRIRLSNLRMNNYARELTEKNLSDAEALWEQVQTGEEQNGTYLVRTGGGRTLLFGRSGFRTEGEEVLQTTAADITELACIRAELQERNRKLLDVQVRMKAYQVKAAEMLVDQERLNARIAVHDGLGSLLLHCRYYLENPGEVDEEELLRMLRRTNRYLLREAEEPAEQRDPVQEAMRMAQGIGVRVKLSGELPEKESLRGILGQAIGECAVNTVKHAGGDELLVSAEEPGRVIFTNSGEAPEKVPVETGGLRSLRCLVEAAGGSMVIESAPEFRLTLELPGL